MGLGGAEATYTLVYEPTDALIATLAINNVAVIQPYFVRVGEAKCVPVSVPVSVV